MKTSTKALGPLIKSASAADILGSKAATRPNRRNEWPTQCNYCGKPLINARITALTELKTPLELWACVGCSTTTPKRAIYTGEVGTSPLLFVDKLYDYGVRDVFGSPDAVPTEEAEEKE